MMSDELGKMWVTGALNLKEVISVFNKELQKMRTNFRNYSQSHSKGTFQESDKMFRSSVHVNHGGGLILIPGSRSEDFSMGFK
jgi:hypothetical protein